MGMRLQLVAVEMAELRELLALAARGGGEEVETRLRDSERVLDLRKAWHGLHWCLTGEAWGGPRPLGDAVMGALELGELDLGYGPPRYLEADRVVEVNEALEGVSEAAFRARFDGAAMMAAGIYAVSPDPEDAEQELGWLMEALGGLRAFYAEAARARLAVVSLMT